MSSTRPKEQTSELLAQRLGGNKKNIEDGDSQVSLDLEMFDDLSAVKSATVKKSSKKYKPSDPAIELSHVRARELENMMNIGQQRAEAVLMGAGFLGGASNPVIFIYIQTVVVGAVFGGAAAFYATVQSIPAISKYSTLVFLFWGLVVSWTRAFLLFRKMFRRAYWSIVFMLAFWAILVLISYIIEIVRCFSSTFVVSLCGTPLPLQCSGSSVRNAKVLIVAGNSIMLADCLLAITLSMQLAENRFQAASSTLTVMLLFPAFACVLNAVAYIGVGLSGSGLRNIFFAAGFLVLAAILWEVRRRVRLAADSKVAKDREK